MQTECRPIELKPDLSPLGRSIREEIRKDLIVVTTSSVKAVELCYLQPTNFDFFGISNCVTSEGGSVG